MRFASTLFALAAAALVVAQPSPRQATKTLNPPRSDIVHTLADEIAAASAEPQSNAKRFAAGLPPLTPRSLLRHRKRQAPHGGSRVDTARRSATSPGMDDDTKCNILVTRTDGSELGYLKPAWNDYGEYGTFQDSQSGALEVRFPKGSTSQIDFWADNSPSPKYPYFGSSTGWSVDDDSIGQGSPNFAYLVGTQQTPKGSPAAEAGDSFSDSTVFDKNVQSAIWKYESNTQEITAQWVNMDGSRPGTYLFHSDDENSFLGVAGDIAELNTVYKTNCFEVKFHCVPPVPVIPVIPV